MRAISFPVKFIAFTFIFMGYLSDSNSQGEPYTTKNTQLRSILPSDPVGLLFNDGPRTIYIQNNESDSIERLFWNQNSKLKEEDDSNYSDKRASSGPKIELGVDRNPSHLVEVGSQPKQANVDPSNVSEKIDADRHSNVQSNLQLQANQAIQSIPSANLSGGDRSGIALKSAMWPVDAKPKNIYGSMDKQGQQLRGLIFDVPINSPVKSIAAGRIMFADFFKNYGNLIIVSHGDRLVSIYTNNQKLLKKEGDVVVRGETIALSGESGNLNYPALYFEIRKDGKTTNPTQYLEGT